MGSKLEISPYLLNHQYDSNNPKYLFNHQYDSNNPKITNIKIGGNSAYRLTFFFFADRKRLSI